MLSEFMTKYSTCYIGICTIGICTIGICTIGICKIGICTIGICTICFYEILRFFRVDLSIARYSNGVIIA